MRKPVFFETGMSQFTAEDAYSARAVKRVSQRMKITRRSSVVLVGMTDIQGDASTNQSLSQQRAEYVRDQLIREGVDANRITVVGLGEVEAQRKRAVDRRVEFVYHRTTKGAPDSDTLRDRFAK